MDNTDHDMQGETGQAGLPALSTDELQALAVNALKDLKAVDVRVLDVQGLTSITDMPEPA